MLSSTVTMAEQVAVLPLASVAVSVTVFAPISLQSKVDGSTVKLVMPQLSEEPLSISAATMLAFPAASNSTVTS